MYRKRSFFWRYEREGMDEMEFTESESWMHDIICEYEFDTNDYCDHDIGEGGE